MLICAYWNIYILGVLFMIKITERAIDAFKNLLIEEGANYLYIKFFYSGSKCCINLTVNNNE